MKKLTRDRVVQIISANVSCVIDEMKVSRFTWLAKFRHQQKKARQSFLARVEKLIDRRGVCGAH